MVADQAAFGSETACRESREKNLLPIRARIERENRASAGRLFSRLFRLSTWKNLHPRFSLWSFCLTRVSASL